MFLASPRVLGTGLCVASGGVQVRASGRDGGRAGGVDQTPVLLSCATATYYLSGCLGPIIGGYLESPSLEVLPAARGGRSAGAASPYGLSAVQVYSPSSPGPMALINKDTFPEASSYII